MKLLTDRVAVMTRGAQGLGRAIADQMVAEGARVVIADIDQDAARAAADEIGSDAVAVRCDVTSEVDVATVIDEAVASFGRLDVMVNNAGVLRDATMRKMTLEDFRLVIDIHLQGTWLGTRAAAAYMRENGGGSVVNMSSISRAPLELGRDFGLSSSRVGGITVALAASIALFAPVSSRIGERIISRRVLDLGLAVLVCTPLLLSAALSLEGPALPLVVAFGLLAVSACAIGSVQSVSALGVMRSPAAGNGAALGIHNTARFSGLAVGYALGGAQLPDRLAGPGLGRTGRAGRAHRADRWSGAWGARGMRSWWRLRR